MYKPKDRQTKPLFSELLPFGGQLDETNRWLRIAQLIPWDELEGEYASHFSHTGRPGTDGRLFIGLMLLKHMTGASDRESVEAVLENPYMQMFCGFESFVTRKMLDASTLTRLRKKVGIEFFRYMEERTYRLLIERRIIRAKGMLVDATVFPENVKYPSDVGLLNKAREWLVERVTAMGRRLEHRYRTYKRTARKVYLNFAKKKTKRKKTVEKAKRQMLNFVRRLIGQFHDAKTKLGQLGRKVERQMLERFQVVQRLYEQQRRMYREKSHRVADRIVSVHRPYVRPVVRGKSGREVEFGPKVALTHAGGFMFVEHFSHDVFSEADEDIVRRQVKKFRELFGKKPEWLTGDRLYGNRKNRDMLKRMRVEGALPALGRPRQDENGRDRWLKKRQRERNRIEGGIGHGKEHFMLDRIRYQSVAGSEMWVRCGVLAMNLKTALAKMG